MMIQILKTAEEIQDAFPVMEQLRPLLRPSEFLPRVFRQMEQGYHLAAIIDEDEITCLAGFRIQENLAWGKHLYVDDLITQESARSRGYGEAIMDWLKEFAKDEGCKQLHLDSGTQRMLAHRFYFRQNMFINSYHFGMEL